VAEVILGDVRCPAHGARFGVEGHQVGVERADVDGVVEDRDAAVGGSVTYMMPSTTTGVVSTGDRPIW